MAGRRLSFQQRHFRAFLAADALEAPSTPPYIRPEALKQGKSSYEGPGPFGAQRLLCEKGLARGFAMKRG
jgi:hypothetical protein